MTCVRKAVIHSTLSPRSSSPLRLYPSATGLISIGMPFYPPNCKIIDFGDKFEKTINNGRYFFSSGQHHTVVTDSCRLLDLCKTKAGRE